jgi:hypothetical protein
MILLGKCDQKASELTLLHIFIVLKVIQGVVIIIQGCLEDVAIVPEPKCHHYSMLPSEEFQRLPFVEILLR